MHPSRSSYSQAGPAAGSAAFSSHKRSSLYYDQVDLYVNALESATTISKRREASEQLLTFFKNRQNRIGLAQDCIAASLHQSSTSHRSFSTSSSSSSSKRKHDEDSASQSGLHQHDTLSRLKQIIGQVIQVAIKACQTTFSSKSKLTVQDVTLVHTLLLAVDGPLGGGSSTSSSSSSTKSHSKSRTKSSIVVHEPFTFDSFDRYRNTHVGMTLLSSTNIQNVLTYTLNALEDEAVYSVAEMEWLDLLKTLCSRVDYVCHFRLATDYNLIFNQIQARLFDPTTTDDSSSSMKMTTTMSVQRRQKSQLMLIASKIFHALLVQSAVKLKLDMQVYVRPCLRMVSDWTQTSYASEETVAQNLFMGIVPLIAAYAESAVCILADDAIGYPLWEYAIKWWDRTPLSNSRDALVDYFSAHILVCEMAGRLQGRLPGDLGYVGSVSLDGIKMNHLRCRILTEKTVLSYVNGSLSSTISTSKSVGAMLSGKKNKGITQSPYNSLNRRDRRYLELCSRILRCSQRIFLAKAEYEIALDQETLGQFDEDGLHSKVANLSEDLFQESPWIEYVIHPLCAKNVEPYMASFSGSEKDEGKTLNSSQHIFPTSVTGATFPSDPLLVVGYLQLISACTEMFPRGECWSSTNRWTRTNYCPYSNSLEGSTGVESFCAISSLQDLARLVRLITTILEYYAGVSGAQTVQAWALICLLKLTESTCILQRYVKSETDVAPESLGLAWRSTWNALFRSELRYTSSTSNLSTGSLGELVVMLMTEMVQGQCTSLSHSKSSDQKNAMKETSSFFYSHQDDVWNLPLYKSAESITTSLAFELVTSLLHTVDLREGADDSFCMALCEDKGKVDNFSDALSFRRLRIALFCVSVLEVISNNAIDETLRRLSPYIASCLSALIGSFIPIRTSYRMRSVREFQCTEDSINSKDLIHYGQPSCTVASKIDLTLLWCDIISPFGEQFTTEIGADTWRGLHDMDLRLTPSWAAEDRAWSLQRVDHDYVSTPTSTLMQMRKRVYQFTMSNMKRLTTEYGLTSSACLLPLLKCTLSFYLSFRDDAEFRHELSDFFHECIARISSKYASVIDQAESSLIALDLVGFFRLLRFLHELNVTPELFMALDTDTLSRIFNHSKKKIELFIKNRDPFAVAFNILGYESHETTRSSEEQCNYQDDDSEQIQTDDYESEKVRKRPKLDLSEAVGNSSSLTKKILKDGTLSTHRKFYSIEDEIVNSRDAWLSASLLLLLDPTYKSVQYIFDSLIRPSAIAISTGKETPHMGSYDPHDSLMGVSLITSFVSPCNSVCLSLCSDVILKGRFDAAASSVFNFMGFLSFSAYFSRHMLSYSSSFSEEDYHKAMSIMDPERSEVLHKDSVKIARRFLRDRPSLRIVQLKAAKQCFTHGTNSFHDAFDLTYAEAFVKPFLTSLNAEIRAAAIQCLAAALSIFASQDQIVSETLQLLSFEAFKSDSGKDLVQWILRIAAPGSNKVIQSHTLRDAWADSVQSATCDVFECLGVMGALVTDEIRSDILIDILRVCTKRSQMSALGFRCLNEISRKHEHNKVEDLITYHGIVLIEYYLESGNDLASLPIVMSYPSLFLYQTRLNLSSSSFGQVSPSPDHTEDLQVLSFRIFVTNNLSTILPRIIVKNPNERSVKDGDKRWKYIAEISMIFSDGNSDSHIAKLIRKCFPEIYAYITPLIQSKINTKDNHASGLEAMQFLSKVLTKEKVDKYLAAYCHLVTRKLVQLSGKGSSVHKNFKVDYDAYFRSINAVAVSCTPGSNQNISPDIDVFQRAGTTITEIAIYALKDFGSAMIMNEKTHAWQSLKHFCKNILNDRKLAGKQVDAELLLFIFKLLSLASVTRDASMKLNIMSQVSLMLDKILEFEGVLIKNEDSDCPWGMIFCSLIQIHNDCAVMYADACNEYSRNIARIDRLSTNLLSVVGEQRLAPVSREIDFNVAIDSHNELRDITILVHDMLLKMQHHAIKFSYMNTWKLQYIPESALSRAEEDSLRLVNEKFSISTIKDNLRQVEGDIMCELTNSLSTLKSHRSGISPDVTASHTSNIDHNRVIMKVLERLIVIFQDVQLHYSETEIFIVRKIRMELMSLCSTSLPIQIRISASECLGRLFCHCAVPSIESVFDADSLDASYEVMDSTLPSFYNDPLTHIHVSALRRLAKYVQSRDIDIAIIAIDTVYALLDTTSGQSCWLYVNDEDVKRVISPMKASINQTSRGPPKVDSSEISIICQRYGADGNHDLSSICWGKGLWSYSEIPFNDWIRHVTFILLTCCYGPGKESSLPRNAIKGSCDFFHPCARMCLTDANFAALIFPGIIFDLLDSNKGSDKPVINKTTKGTLMSRESIGSPHSPANQLLTECISQVLKKTDPEATELVASVLNMLRRITERRFLQSSHSPNLSISKERLYPDDNNSSRKSSLPVVSDENYNIDLQPNIRWSGRPYGTVLQLNGLDVANAFALAQRWEGALYYSEFYADNRLGTSGSLFERIADQEDGCGQFSISGFGTRIEDIMSWSPFQEISKETFIQRTARFRDVYKLSLTQIHEIDEMDGLFQQFSFFSSSLTGSFQYNDLKALNTDGHSSDITKLLHNDAQMQAQNKTNVDDFGVESSRNVIACLRRLGVRHVLQNYISCMINDYQDNINTNGIEFHDHLAEENWRMMLWSSIDDLSKSSNTCVLDKKRSLCHADEGGKGFNDYFIDMAQSLLSDDQPTFRLLSSRCRIRICDTVNGHTFQRMWGRTETEQLIMRLNILNDFDDIGSILFQQCDNFDTVTNLLDTWDRAPNDTNHSLTFQDIDFLFSARELGLRILHRKIGMNHNIIDRKLKSHLLRMCKIARQSGIPNIAETALARFKKLDSFSSREGLFNHISVALEEARITELYGDSTFAITKTKSIINNLQSILNREQDDDYKLLLAESCLQCGEWLMRTKAESSTSILEKYLRPAASLSQVAYDNNKTCYRANLLSDANFTLGDFAATSYESIQAKMKTHDYKIALTSSSYRASELKECQRIILDLKIESDNTKSKAKGSNGSRKSTTEQRDKEHFHDLERRIHDLGQHIRTLEREIELDTRERLAMKHNCNIYLTLAIQSYGTALSYCDTSSFHSTHVFRMMSLWFQTSTIDHEIHTIMANLIAKIPSFHFVPLTYQIFSRIDKSPPELASQLQPSENPLSKSFQCVLRLLVTKMCIDHPYHCLVQLLALSNGNKVQSGSGGKHAALYLSNVGENKVEVCKGILKTIRHDSPTYVSSLIDSYTMVMNSYYALAMTPTNEIIEKYGSKDISMRDVNAIGIDPAVPALDRCLGSANRKLFDAVPCILTKTPILRPTADYGDGTTDPVGSERIHSFESFFSLTDSGIHRPKIVTCVGTSGKRYKQLVKGDDDIRQDAIMQQVFATVNNLLRKNDLSTRRGQGVKTANQDLKIITYACVPITPNSGIIEWVNDTVPFGDCLGDKRIGKQHQLGLHSKYYPGEWGNSLCRTHLKNSPKDQLRQSYDQICKHFSPAFRFFFLERFSHDLRLWYEARKRYVKSCAVNSIAGHILGIGDRHSLNILVHQKTGDIVHIDFGVVFEQGKLLPMPEIIPFRLTRDIVDGFGPIGTEGTFVATAVTTLAVLRENTNALMTILSAVVSDPLYKWCINPLTARLRQRDESEDGKNDPLWISNGKSNHPSNTEPSTNSDNPDTTIEMENDAASRTLAKIVKKLQGFEDGSSGESQTVEGQVRMLIQAAKNPDNLCQMYCGWAPWL